MMRIRKRLLEIHDLPGLEVEDPTSNEFVGVQRIALSV
jgi:hypothetical protein